MTKFLNSIECSVKTNNIQGHFGLNLIKKEFRIQDKSIPSSPPDLDCKDIPQKKFTVLQPDPHRFDGDKNGVGCESQMKPVIIIGIKQLFGIE